MVTAIVLSLVFALSAVAGALTQKNRGLAAGGLIVAIFSLILRVAFATFRDIEARAVPWDLYPFVEHFWVVPFGGFILGVAAVHLKRRAAQLAALGAGTAAFAWLGVVAFEMTAAPPKPLTGIVSHGVCLQTSNFSCGPAAAAMWLDDHDVLTTESEMADLSVTDPWYGTSTVGMLRGLHRKMPGAELRLERIETPPAEARGPWLVVVELSQLLAHWVVIDRIDAEGADVRDPIEGRTRWSREDLERRWTALVVRAD